MIIRAKGKVPTRDIPIITRDELESDWRKARECFEQALAQKIETNRLYVAAATKLNTIERLVKRVKKQEMLAKRVAARSFTKNVDS